MMLGKIPIPGRPANFDNDWAMVFSACSWCGGYLDIFLSFIISLFFQPMGDGPI